MLKKSILIALAAIATAASAQEATPDNWMSEAKSVLSRDEARADAIAFRASGELARSENPGYLPTVAQSKLRAEVIAELMRAHESGEYAELNAEAHDFASASGRVTRTAWFRFVRLM